MSMLIKNLRLKIEKIGKIYILPTRYGFYFLFFVFILFLFSLTYGHSMAFTSTFLFVSILMTSAAVTNFNLKYIEVYFHPPKITIQVDKSQSIIVSLKSSFERGAVWIESYPHKAMTFSKSSSKEVLTIKNNELEMEVTAHTRGIYNVSQWYLKTCYPMGLFTAWRPIKAPVTVRVLPKSVDYYIVPLFLEETQKANEHFMLVEHKNDEDFYEYKAHLEGEPWRLIDWKILAKADIYLKKSFSSDQRNGRYLFDYEKLIDLNHEEKLSQMVFWIFQAIDSKMDFVVHFPGSQYQHYSKESCLENLWDQLALYERSPLC